MKILPILMMAMCMMLPLSACESSDNPDEVDVPKTTTQMNITVNGHTLTAKLDNNVTAQAFAAKLPINYNCTFQPAGGVEFGDDIFVDSYVRFMLES